MNSPLILVTGATGYIASRLIPRLLDAGYRVRCLARDPLRLKGRAWFRQVEVVQGDVTIPSTLDAALKGVHTAYYLIHNMTYGNGYTTLEVDSARAFAVAAAKANIEHIIYLGGLADPEQHIAPHMRSRIETGRVLREGKVPVTEFRAGVITGSGSISFEMIRFMTELFPMVPGPSWMRNKSQPIAIQNVIDYLFAALTNPDGRGGVFEIGGPDITTYGDLMLRYARIRGLKRNMFLIPGIPIWFMAFGVGVMTPVPYHIAYALIGGLSADSIVKHPDALRTFPEVKLIDFDSATRDALEKTHPTHIERVWTRGKNFDGLPQDTTETSEVWTTLKHEGCFIDHREILVRTSPENIIQSIQALGQVDIENTSDDVQATLHEKVGRSGEQWIEWRTSQVENLIDLSQTVFFCPRGLLGFIYWYFLYPFHIFGFHRLIRGVSSKAQKLTRESLRHGESN